MTKPIIGILGGGQLGMMLCDAAKEIDIETHVFCPDDDCPSKGRSTYFSIGEYSDCLLYTSPSPRDATLSRMPSSA